MRGRLTHRLIELLPGLDPAGWEKSAHGFLKAEAKELAAAERAALIADVIGILTHREFGALFASPGQAEVPIAAELPSFWDGGPPVTISGQIDRLLLDKTGILILDYKTGASIPETPERTPRPYLVQLAAYKLALARLFPAQSIRAALLWTEAPCLMPISPDLIGLGERLLYESVRSRHLDP
ncbi:MAG: hypothetical protein HC850_12150 [Rhodomicrobium sp.]|nr:hypothetical protein [Rhodomicrobium sp.]